MREIHVTVPSLPTEAELANKVDEFAALLNQQPLKTMPNSAFDADSKLCPVYPPAHMAWGAIGLAIEHLDTCKRLVIDQHVVHSHASFTPLRAAIENISTAIWLIAPATSSDRITRSLRWHHKNFGYERAFLNELPAADVQRIYAGKPSTAEKQAKIRKAAIAAGISESALAGKLDFSSIVKDAGRAVGFADEFNPAIIIWKACSGFTHGQLWARLALLDRQTTPGSNTGEVHLRATAELDQVLGFMAVPVKMTTWALQTYSARRQPPSQ